MVSFMCLCRLSVHSLSFSVISMSLSSWFGCPSLMTVRYVTLPSGFSLIGKRSKAMA